ncbi:MAG TPA: methionine--tRNA ligase [Thermoanaerobaculia bacterium]|nr:methionine--tRNA ligase [Thermoanaerobaculia bacterium]
MGTHYVTTPIYYVNDLPHIGHVYTTVVADAVARYRRLSGDDTYFLTGTDEHGQNIERAAREQGVEPIALADRVVTRYHELWEEYAISHDDFLRTTQPRHRPAVDEVIRRIEAAGDLYTAAHEGWYCPACETFYTEKELGEGHRCPVHERATEWKSEENVFFRLGRYQEPLLRLYAEHPEFVRPETRRNEVRAFVEGGLRDLSVSRASLAWGLPFPNRPGQTVYVWLDALSNYISALGFGADPGPLYERYWAAPEATRLHLVGKDILRFHAVYWPAFLMSAGLPLPTTVWAHGWWLRDQKKVSKSSGNLVRPDELVARFGTDALRYFLLREMVFGQDASFSDEAFAERYNADLANTLGNTVSRVVTLSRRAFDGQTPPEPCDANPVKTRAAEVVAEYRAAMDELAFHRALTALWRLLDEANQYLVEREPWKRMKQEGGSPAVSRVLWNCLEAVRIVATGLLPFMPQTAPRVLAAIGLPVPPERIDAMAWGGTPTSALLPEPEPIFPRIDKEAWLGEAKTAAAAGQSGGKAAEPAEEKAAASASDDEEGAGMIDIDRFFETELRVATVKVAERVPKSNKLLRLEVDLGGEIRQLVAGIGKAYEPEALVGRQVVVVANLKPAKLMGIESQGMVLAASPDGGDPVLVHPERLVPAGTRVR